MAESCGAKSIMYFSFAAGASEGSLVGWWLGPLGATYVEYGFFWLLLGILKIIRSESRLNRQNLCEVSADCDDE